MTNELASGLTDLLMAVVTYACAIDLHRKGARHWAAVLYGLASAAMVGGLYHSTTALHIELLSKTISGLAFVTGPLLLIATLSMIRRLPAVLVAPMLGGIGVIALVIGIIDPPFYWVSISGGMFVMTAIIAISVWGQGQSRTMLLLAIGLTFVGLTVQATWTGGQGFSSADAIFHCIQLMANLLYWRTGILSISDQQTDLA